MGTRHRPNPDFRTLNWDIPGQLSDPSDVPWGSPDLAGGSKETGGASILLLKVGRLIGTFSPRNTTFQWGSAWTDSWDHLIVPSEIVSHAGWKAGQDPKSLTLELAVTLQTVGHGGVAGHRV